MERIMWHCDKVSLHYIADMNYSTSLLMKLEEVLVVFVKLSLKILVFLLPD